MSSPMSSRRPLATLLATGIALFFALGAVLVTSLIGAQPASAHAALVKVTPAANERLTTAPRVVVLEFDEPVSPRFATVVVTTAAGLTVARGKPTLLGAKVTQALIPNVGSGSYRIAFRVVSNDGHPVSGQSTFTLTSPSGTTPATVGGNPVPATVPPSRATPSLGPVAGASVKSPNPGQGGRLSRFLAPMAGAVGFLAIGGGVLLWDRQRRRT